MAYESEYEAYVKECLAEGLEPDTFEDYHADMLAAEADRWEQFSYFHSARA
jgi:hypothetical protein